MIMYALWLWFTGGEVMYVTFESCQLFGAGGARGLIEVAMKDETDILSVRCVVTMGCRTSADSKAAVGPCPAPHISLLLLPPCPDWAAPTAALGQHVLHLYNGLFTSSTNPAEITSIVLVKFDIKANR